MSYDYKFGQRLRAARKAKWLSTVQLGRITDISHNTISSLELGRNQPRLDTAILLADALDVSLDYLAGRNDEGGRNLGLEERSH